MTAKNFGVVHAGDPRPEHHAETAAFLAEHCGHMTTGMRWRQGEGIFRDVKAINPGFRGFGYVSSDVRITDAEFLGFLEEGAHEVGISLEECFMHYDEITETRIAGGATYGPGEQVRVYADERRIWNPFTPASRSAWVHAILRLWDQRDMALAGIFLDNASFTLMSHHVASGGRVQELGPLTAHPARIGSPQFREIYESSVVRLYGVLRDELSNRGAFLAANISNTWSDFITRGWNDAPIIDLAFREYLITPGNEAFASHYDLMAQRFRQTRDAAAVGTQTWFASRYWDRNGDPASNIRDNLAAYLIARHASENPGVNTVFSCQPNYVLSDPSWTERSFSELMLRVAEIGDPESEPELLEGPLVNVYRRRYENGIAFTRTLSYREKSAQLPSDEISGFHLENGAGMVLLAEVPVENPEPDPEPVPNPVAEAWGQIADGAALVQQGAATLAQLATNGGGEDA